MNSGREIRFRGILVIESWNKGKQEWSYRLVKSYAPSSLNKSLTGTTHFRASATCSSRAGSIGNPNSPETGTERRD